MRLAAAEYEKLRRDSLMLDFLQDQADKRYGWVAGPGKSGLYRLKQVVDPLATNDLRKIIRAEMARVEA